MSEQIECSAISRTDRKCPTDGKYLKQHPTTFNAQQNSIITATTLDSNYAIIFALHSLRNRTDDTNRKTEGRETAEE